MKTQVLERIDNLVELTEKQTKTFEANNDKISAFLVKASSHDEALKSVKDMVEGLKGRVEEAVTKAVEDEDARKRLDKIEEDQAKLVDAIKKLQLGGVPQAPNKTQSLRKSIAQEFTESEAFKYFQDNIKVKSAGAKMEFKSIHKRRGRSLRRKSVEENDLSTTTGGSANTLVTPDYRDELIEEPKIQPLFRSLMEQGTTESNSVNTDREIADFKLVAYATSAESAGSNTMTLNSVAGLSNDPNYRNVTVKHANGDTQAMVIASISGLVVTFTTTVTAAIAANDRLEAEHYIATPEGSESPKIQDEWEDTTATVRKLTAHATATEEALADPQQAPGLFERRVIDKAVREEDYSFAYGQGGNTDLDGFMVNTDITEVLWSSSAAGTKRLRFIVKLYYMLVKRNYMPSAVVLSPDDHEAVTMSTGTDGQFLFLAVQTDGGPARIFGIQLLMSNQLKSGDGIIADWRRAFVVYDRQQAELTVGTVGSDFTQGKRTMRVMQRLAFHTRRPKAALRFKFDSQP